jgi:hypothetical protein
MIESDIDLRLRRWLAADAAAATIPAGLRARVLDIPATRPRRVPWHHRFAALSLAGSGVAAVTIAAVVLSGAFFRAFDREPGVDGGLCNNRQLQTALDELRDSPGYRYVDTQQQQVIADESAALDNPEFDWADSRTAEVAYLAPDRTREVVTPLDPEFNPGYFEQVRIGNEQWQLRDVDGTPTWFRTTPWPFGNWAWGYVQNALGLLGTPGIASIRFGSEPVPDGLTGQGGCTIAAVGEVDTNAIALRVGSDGRVSDIYLGPRVTTPGTRQAFRNLIQLEYTLPSPDEFVAPATFEDDPEVSGEVVEPPPAPSIGPLAPPEGGWEPIPLPLGDQALDRANVSDVHRLDDGSWLAVGGGWAGDDPYPAQALVWTSPDAVEWELVDGPPEFAGLSLASVVTDGETLLAVGYRAQEPREDGTADPDRPETWLSRDGVTWEFGGAFEAGANPSELVPTDFGWVAGGTLWSTEPVTLNGEIVPAAVQNPAFFSSRDGKTWETHRPEELTYGMVGTPVVEPDGTIRAESCETPEASYTISAEQCFTREWTSTDGANWTPGPTITDPSPQMQVSVSAGDGFLAIGSDEETFEPTLLRSRDGVTWEPAETPAGAMYPSAVVEIDGGVAFIAQASDGVTTVTRVWTTSDGGETWEAIPLGVTDGAVGLSVEHVLSTEAGLVLVGSISVDAVNAVPVVWREP